MAIRHNRVTMYGPPDGRLAPDEFAMMLPSYHRVAWDGRNHLILVLGGGHGTTGSCTSRHQPSLTGS